MTKRPPGSILTFYIVVANVIFWGFVGYWLISSVMAHEPLHSETCPEDIAGYREKCNEQNI